MTSVVVVVVEEEEEDLFVFNDTIEGRHEVAFTYILYTVTTINLRHTRYIPAPWGPIMTSVMR